MVRRALRRLTERLWTEYFSTGSAIALRRDTFLRGRSGTWIEDDAFVQEILPSGSPVQVTIAKALRYIVAEECGIARQLISPCVRNADLLGIIVPGIFVYGPSYFDSIHVKSYIERELAVMHNIKDIRLYVCLVQLRSFSNTSAPSSDDRVCFGEWVRRCVKAEPKLGKHSDRQCGLDG